MYRWSKISEERRPEIISDISNDKFYTLKVQDYTGKKLKRKDASASVIASITGACPPGFFVAWEGSYWYEGIFKDIIDKNIPCILMHKVKNKWATGFDTIVCFMTGDTLDVFLIHPDDLTEWDSNENIR